MKEMSLISVIIPAYNAESWIGEACQSVLEQTYENWELIIVDDGSCDRTYEIVCELAERYPSVRPIHTENGGVSRARNLGLAEAKGEYITLLDADDRLTPQALEAMYASLQEHHADIAIGWAVNMTQEGELTECPYKKEKKLLMGEESLEYSLRDHPSMYAAWGKLYKRSFLSDIHFIEGRRIHEDTYFVFQCCLRQPRVILLEDIVLQYRSTTSSASRAAFSDKFFDILYFAEQKKAAIDQLYPHYADLSENMLIKANMAMLRNLCKTRDRKYRKIEKKCIKEIIKRKDKFISAIEGDQQFFRIITRHMYGIYKTIYILIKK
ncbi:MAG: glycosyltransferase family 2 protein [Clostridia bacterium]|nr:glycosyltransferase family 2 protein [Clostridia bacterium]